LKFNSRTLEPDGFVKKETCLCDEAACSWWRPATDMCAVANLVEVINKLELVAGMQLKALLSDFQSKTTIVDVER
jgi:hypothetical protein